jgi:hypothetical protein
VALNVGFQTQREYLYNAMIDYHHGLPMVCIWVLLCNLLLLGVDNVYGYNENVEDNNYDYDTVGNGAVLSNQLYSSDLSPTYLRSASRNLLSVSSVIFNYTGTNQTWVVPDGITYINIQCYGAQGSDNSYNFNYGGKGGYATGDLSVTPGEIFYVHVGGAGRGAKVGFNGGGISSIATGGGASDIRRGGNDFINRIIVAGGGAGAGTYNNDADGGKGGGHGWLPQQSWRWWRQSNKRWHRRL